MKIKQIVFFLCLAFFSATLLTVDSVEAAHCTPKDAPAYDTFILPCPSGGKDGISMVLDIVKNVLTVLVGIAAVGGIVYGSILYATAGGSSENTKKGLAIIRDTVIGVVVYILMYVLLNYVIPGGVS